MGKEIVALATLVTVAIVVGLVLRYGATSVPLGNTAAGALGHSLNDLTLQGGGYSYYPPGETVNGG